jgi:hypothetical protein
MRKTGRAQKGAKGKEGVTAEYAGYAEEGIWWDPSRELLKAVNHPTTDEHRTSNFQLPTLNRRPEP